jgi:uncharacterized protein (TIGR00290 family)
MLDESGERSRSHGLPLGLLQAQAAACGLPLVTRSASWAGYTDAFADGLAELRQAGARRCVFGDVDLDDHRRWCRDVCARAGLEAVHPLWGRDRRGLVEELLARGFAATIVVVRDGVLDRKLLGRRLDADLLTELEALGVDACGENGEFHTAVDDAPYFERPLRLRPDGELTVADCRCLRLRCD